MIAKLACLAREKRDDLARNLYRVDAARGQCRMRSATAYTAAVTALALVRDDHAHARGLSDDAAIRLDPATRDVGDETPHADAAHFFVIRKRQVQGPFQAAAAELGDEGQRDRAKALHVCHAA